MGCRRRVRPSCPSPSSVARPASCAPTSTATIRSTAGPFMQRGHRGADAIRSSDDDLKGISFDRSTPPLLEADTEENLQRAVRSRSSWTDFLPDRAARPRSASQAMLAGHEPQPGRGRRADAPDRLPRVLGVHGREGRGERGDGRAREPEYLPVILAMAASGITARSSSTTSFADRRASSTGRSATRSA